MSLDPTRRARVVSWVRPLYAGLDGVDVFSRVERRLARARRLLEGSAHDAEYLELLTLFHDPASRLPSTAPGGRWWLFLRDLGIDERRLERLRQGLERWESSPQGPEEEALHDARLLEEVGVAACARRLWWAGRKRVALERAVGALDPGPVPERFRTEPGRLEAAQRRAAGRDWIETLRPAFAPVDRS